MRHLRTISLCLTLLCAAPAVVTGGGCALFQSTPAEQVRDAGATYLAVVNTLNAARASGAIGYEQWHNDINPLIQEGRNVYNDLNAAVLAGDATTADLLRASLEGIVARLLIYPTHTQGDEP